MGDYPTKVIKIKRDRKFFLLLTSLIIFGGLGLYMFLNPSKPWMAAPKNALTAKLVIAQEGLYGFTLRDVFGSNGDNINPSKIQLTHKGEPVPLWVSTNDNDQTLFRFWGTAPDNLYTRGSIYLLKVLDGTSTSKLGAIPEAIITTNHSKNAVIQTTFLSSVYLEENEIYSPHAPLNDAWFWKLIGAPGKVEFPIEVVGLIPGQFHATLDLWSNTAALINPDHHITIAVNEVVICEDLWDGSGTYEAKCTFSTEILQSGKNILSIQLPGIKDVPAEALYINKIRLEYPKALNMNEDGLLFTANADLVKILNIDNSIDLFDITDPYQAEWITSGKPDENIFGTISGHQYLAVNSDNYQPVTIAPAIADTSLSNTAGADYLVVGDEDLIKAALPLIKHRAAQGLTTLSVPINEIFDLYGYGYPDPTAVQMFISHTQTWDIKPRYILLLGDASYDPRGYIASSEKNRLPTFFTLTEYGGYTATDIPFVDINDDKLPDIAIGRIPAETPDQLKIAVNKIIKYETGRPTNQWASRVLLIADGQESEFLLEAKAFLTSIPSTYSVDIFSPSAGTINNNTNIIDKINNGQGLIVYFGHGSIQMWGKDQLFSVNDIGLLNNNTKLPIVINMTCLTGLFTHPTIESLSEAFLWSENGGAAAVLAPTSLTLPSDQSFLSNALANYIFINNTERLGDAVLASWKSIPAGQGRDEVLNTFLLLGDPALMIQRSSNTSK